MQMPMNDPFGYIPKLPDNIRNIFMRLCQDVYSLRSKWEFYLDLFDSKENAELISELARASFQIIEESLRNDMIMAICRLSDPSQSSPKSKKKDNLSLCTLFEQLDGPNKAPKLLENFLVACESVRQFRNKLVGHNDLKTRIKP
jgi:hypothetical protein